MTNETVVPVTTECKATVIVKGLGLAKGLEAQYEKTAMNVDSFEKFGMDCVIVKQALINKDIQAVMAEMDVLTKKWHKALAKHYKTIGAVFMPLDELIGCPDNPRINADGSGLLESLANDGLKEPVLVNQHKMIAQGHRRTHGLKMLQATNPKAFEFWFSQGIPVEQREMDAAEFIALLCDHGSTEPLNNQFEVYSSYALLRSQGLSESKCMETIRTAVDRILPMKGQTLLRIQGKLLVIKDTQDQIEACTDEVTKAQLLGELRARQVEFNTDWNTVRRGTAQYYTRISRLPREVADSFYFQCTGEQREGSNLDKLMKITQGNVKTIDQMFREDVADETGNRIEPGPKYLATVSEYLIKSEAGKEKSVKTKGTPKAMSHANAMKPITEGQVASKSMAALIRKHAGFEESIDMNEVDFALLVVETLKASNPDLWKSCEDYYLSTRNN